jgi:hypothetical protein
MNMTIAPPAPSDQSVTLALPEQLTMFDWEAIGEQIAAQHRNVSWLVGDWIAAGQERFGEQAFAIAERLMGDPKPLRTIVAVAKAVPASRRDPALSFKHYAEVQALPAPEQDALLATAKQQGWHPQKVRHEAYQRRIAIGQVQIWDDDDWMQHSLQNMARAWNRAPIEARQEFAEMVRESDMGVIDV